MSHIKAEPQDCPLAENFSSTTWQIPPEPRFNDVKPAPSSLSQDWCNSNLNSSLSRHKSKIENLISKIKDQINYFSPNDHQTNKVQLKCNLCRKLVRLSKVEKHVTLDDKHLRNVRNLTQQCQSVTAEASEEKNWDYLNFDETSQCYHCTLCNVNLSESKILWNEHFFSDSHNSNLKIVKPEMPDVALSSASSSRQTDSNQNFSRATASSSTNRDNKVLRGVKRTSGILSTEPVKAARNSVYLCGAEFDVWPLSEPIIYQNSNTVSSYEYTDTEKEVIEKLKNDSVSQYFDFLFAEHFPRSNKNKSFFRCHPCGIHLRADSVINHLYVGNHLNNMTLFFNVENFLSLEKSTRNILRRLFRTVGKELVDDFTFLPDKGSEKLQFKCKFCKVILLSDFLVEHLKTNEHQESREVIRSLHNVVKNIDPASVSSEIQTPTVSVKCESSWK